MNMDSDLKFRELSINDNEYFSETRMGFLTDDYEKELFPNRNEREYLDVALALNEMKKIYTKKYAEEREKELSQKDIVEVRYHGGKSLVLKPPYGSMFSEDVGLAKLFSKIIAEMLKLFPKNYENYFQENNELEDITIVSLNDSENINKMWKKNKEFFEKNEDKFMIEYPDLYVAVHDGSVIGTDKRLGSLAGKIYEEKGNIPFYADKPGEESVVMIDSPIC